MGRHQNGTEMKHLLNIIVGITAGIFSAMGLGGGSILMLYLKFFHRTDLLLSRCMNLLFFIPCAAISIWKSKKENLIQITDTKRIMPLALLGLPIGYTIESLIDINGLQKLFGILLIAIGLKGFFQKTTS